MQKSTLLICGKLYDGIHPELLNNVEILIEGNVIREIGQNLSRPAECEVIDLSHLTVTPGLIDAHIHSDIFNTDEGEYNIYNSQDWTNLAHLHTAQRCLERGFTTFRSHACNDPGYGVVAVKRAIDSGYFPGARMNVTCHMLGTEGSHADASQALAGNPNLSRAFQLPTIGSGVDFFRRAVREQAKFGSDFIKFFMSGGFSTPGDGPEDQQLEDDELDAIIQTATHIGKPTTAHVYAGPLMRKLMEHGITGMEHGALMDEETAEMFERTNTYLVPTFCPYNEIINPDEENLAKKPLHFQVKLRKYAKRLQEGRKIIAKSNIRLGYGTDFVAVHQVYESWHEYQSWMRAGIDPFRILKAATSVNAEILEMQDRIGSIEVGKLADISGWHRDLLHDEDALSQCDFVMKDGIQYPAVYSEK